MRIIVILLQLVLLFYYLLVMFVDLHPFNNVKKYGLKRKLIESSIIGTAMIIPVLSFYFNDAGMMTISLMIYLALIVASFIRWWRHYFFQPGQDWLKTYNEIYRDTVQVLPHFKNNPPPPLERIILHILIFFTFINSFLYMVFFVKNLFE